MINNQNDNILKNFIIIYIDVSSSENSYFIFTKKLFPRGHFVIILVKKIESDLCVRVTKGRLIYNQMKRVQKIIKTVKKSRF